MAGLHSEYEKIIKVIDSCETLDHFKVATKMLSFWKIKHQSANINLLYISAECKLKFKQNFLTNTI
jgi:hypothetical protein